MQALLSEHWHAVRWLRPRLRSGVQALHRRLRGRAWVLLHDPVSQRFHRVTPAVWRVLALLDGHRTLDEVWDQACAADPAGHGAAGNEAAAISQPELVQLLSSLHAHDLLQTQVSPDAAEALARFERQRRNLRKQSWLNPLSLRLPLLYPDRWFAAQAGLARALFSAPMLLLWLAVVLPSAVLAWQHGQALTENLSDRVLSASNLALLWLIYPVVKAVHEWAHGMAVKAWGGSVREIGLMLIVFTPVPYVDATDSYRFASKWSRATVAAAGIMAELLLGSLALWVWLLAEPGLVSAVAYNVVLIAGASTLLVNGNPLMRYDGYFVVCDLLELPNLAQRATQYWAYLVDRYAFGAKDASPPVSQTPGENLILALYGAVAPLYRLSISLGLAWFVAGQYPLIGVVVALLTLWSTLVLPLWRGWQHLRQAPALAQRRGQALRRSLWALLAMVGVIVALPLPFHAVHQGVVWLPDEAIVRAEVPGHIVQALRRPGDWVEAGTPLLALDSLPLQAELASAAAALAQTEAQLRRAQTLELARVAPLRSERAARQARWQQAQRRVEATRLLAPVAGRWTPQASTDLAGRYVKRGEVLGYLVARPSERVRVAVTQEDMALIQSALGTATEQQVRLANSPTQALSARYLRQVPGGDYALVSAALGAQAGGEIAVDPAKEGGTHSLRRVFDLELALGQPSPGAVFGDRAWVRFDLGPTPLARQGFVRLRQLFLARLAL